jgi:hypothetical protein
MFRVEKGTPPNLSPKWGNLFPIYRFPLFSNFKHGRQERNSSFWDIIFQMKPAKECKGISGNSVVLAKKKSSSKNRLLRLNVEFMPNLACVRTCVRTARVKVTSGGCATARCTSILQEIQWTARNAASARRLRLIISDHRVTVCQSRVTEWPGSSHVPSQQGPGRRARLSSTLSVRVQESSS